MNEPIKPEQQDAPERTTAAVTTADSSTTSPPPRRPPGSIRLWGFLLLLGSAIPCYVGVVAPYQAALANERVTLLGAKPLLLGVMLLMYGLPMLVAGAGFTRLRKHLPQLGKASSLDMVILVASMFIAYFAEHYFRVVLNGMGYPVPTDW